MMRDLRRFICLKCGFTAETLPNFDLLEGWVQIGVYHLGYGSSIKIDHLCPTCANDAEAAGFVT